MALMQNNTLIKHFPPEWSMCVERQMDFPHIGIMHPLIHKMEVQIMVWEEPMPEPPELLMTMTMPLVIKPIIRLISEAFVDTLYSIPVSMMDHIPNLTPNLTPISMMVWNVQGAGSKAFMAALKEFLRVHKPVVLCLVETHMGGEIADRFSFRGHIRVDAQGFLGGIWLISQWRLSELENFLGILQPLSQKFCYDPQSPLAVGCDFNDTRHEWERSSYSNETRRRARRFDAWIEDMELIEVEFSGPSHTWTRGLSEETRKSARLDRTLCNTEWAERFSNGMVRHLPAIQSDHCSLLISPNGFTPISSMNKPFRFQAA
ncbi:Dynein heavy chain 14 axonemal [Bienertia sinuspersici]